MDNDSSFIGFTGPAITIGLLPDTSNYYSVIYCISAGCYLPTLAVFNKKGTRISKSQIANSCGAGQGYYCSDSLIIDENISITHIQVEANFSYDQTGLKIPESEQRKTLIEHFIIDNSGQIIKRTEETNNGY